MSTKILDFRPATVNGPINRNRARVVWRNDRLYVFSDIDDFMVFENVPEPTKRSDGRTYTAEVTLHAGTPEEHQTTLRWAATGCPSCGFRLGKINVSRLLRQADRQLAAKVDA